MDFQLAKVASRLLDGDSLAFSFVVSLARHSSLVL